MWQGCVLAHTHAEVTDRIVLAILAHPDELADTKDKVQRAHDVSKALLAL